MKKFIKQTFKNLELHLIYRKGNLRISSLIICLWVTWHTIIISLKYDSWGWLLHVFFSHRKEAIIWGRWLFQVVLTGICALNILFYYPIQPKNDHIKIAQHGLSMCSKFGPLINFQCQYSWHQSMNHHWSVLLDETPLQLDREGIKEREDGERGGVGIIRGGRLFSILPSKGSR